MTTFTPRLMTLLLVQREHYVGDSEWFSCGIIYMFLVTPAILYQWLTWTDARGALQRFWQARSATSSTNHAKRGFEDIPSFFFGFVGFFLLPPPEVWTLGSGVPQVRILQHKFIWSCSGLVAMGRLRAAMDFAVGNENMARVARNVLNDDVEDEMVVADLIHEDEFPVRSEQDHQYSKLATEETSPRQAAEAVAAGFQTLSFLE